MGLEDKLIWVLEEGDGLPSSSSSFAGSVLSATELARWQEMKVEKRQREWLLGRQTAKRLLTASDGPMPGAAFSDLTIGNQPEGAPYLVNATVEGCLSISHREERAAAAYLEGPTRVGIDLEVVEPRAMNFVEDFFTAAEVELVLSAPDTERDLWVTLIWSAKEAVLKAWGKGLRVDTRSVEISRSEAGTPVEGWMPLDCRATIPGFPACWLGWRRVGEDVLTLAYEKGAGRQVLIDRIER